MLKSDGIEQVVFNLLSLNVYDTLCFDHYHIRLQQLQVLPGMIWSLELISS